MYKYNNITKDFLQKEYCEECKTQLEIANELNCGRSTIKRKMRKYDIPGRSHQERKQGRFGKRKFNITREFIVREYLIKEKTLAKTGKIIGCSYETIRKYLKIYNIPMRINKRTSEKHYCKEPGCNNEITYSCWKYGQGRCAFCAHKGKKNGMFGKVTHGKWGTYKGIRMRSSYEIAYAKYLDKNNIKWLYESKYFDLGNTTYTPDFYLPETNEYIEIKGYWRDDAKKKFKIFKKQYSNINIKLLGYNVLKKLEILKDKK